MSSPRPAVWLALLALAACAQRLRTYDEPFERDIMTYAVIGHELVLGHKLYADVLDNKPPAIYTTFALAETLAGYGPARRWRPSSCSCAATAPCARACRVGGLQPDPYNQSWP